MLLFVPDWATECQPAFCSTLFIPVIFFVISAFIANLLVMLIVIATAIFYAIGKKELDAHVVEIVFSPYCC